MTPHVVADIGNTRIKWGRCSPQAVVEMASLAPDDVGAWEQQRKRWNVPAASQWVLAGVHPPRREHLAEWLRQRGEQVRIITHPRELPLRTLLPEPEKAGIDRLLNAVASNRRRKTGRAALLVDAGSAVTVDWLDETGAFVGGAILPGFRLMAQALHQYTALLPCIEPPKGVPATSGTTTIQAMEAGLFWSVAGAIKMMWSNYLVRSPHPVDVFLTGGDAALLQPVLPGAVLWPTMTLEGLRWTAESLT